VFPDGTYPQILRAAQILVEEGLCTPVLIGEEERIRERAAAGRIDLRGCEIVEPGRGELFDRLANRLWELRRRKGMPLKSARALVHQPQYFATMLVAEGLADGLVGGLGRPFQHTLGPALRALGTDPRGTGTVSGVYAMLFKDRKIFFGDCTVNIDPDAETLAAIAINTARVAESFGQRPRVAMLSFSDFGELKDHPEVIKVRRAIELVRAQWPELEIDGEMQADTALDWEKMQGTYSFTTLTAPANVLVFPNLTAGNIAYKLLEQLSEADAVGPLVSGIGAPVNVVPVHATVNGIVDAAVYTVNQALDRRV
jgi:malate dehydrogenase (oxaloacetate-decarboxylating)(NADP+)